MKYTGEMALRGRASGCRETKGRQGQRRVESRCLPSAPVLGELSLAMVSAAGTVAAASATGAVAAATSTTITMATTAAGTAAASASGTAAATGRRVAIITATSGCGITAISTRGRRVSAPAAVITAAGGALAHDGAIKIQWRPRPAPVVRTTGAWRRGVPSARSSRVTPRRAGIALPPAALN